MLLGCALVLLVGCAKAARGRLEQSTLGPLVVDGEELDASLVTSKLEDVPLHVPRAVMQANPQLSTDAEFVEAVSRGASQGRLGGAGIRAALYAHYLGPGGIELGLYGLEAASTAGADRREGAVRRIWAYNESLGRARVHRRRNAVVVVWHTGLSPARWEAVNARVAEGLDE